MTRLLALVLFACCTAAFAQAPHPTTIPADQLDPTRNLGAPRLESATHKPLPEQYIWAAHETEKPTRHDQMTAPRYFRRSFHLDTVPAAATLYIAGPRSVVVYLNGKEVGHDQADLDSQIVVHVFAMDVRNALQQGTNVLAIKAVRGRGANGVGRDPLTEHQLSGQLMAVKLVPAIRGVNAPALMMSDGKWRAALQADNGWDGPQFNDNSWSAVEDLGGIESSINLLQWNADAGMYAWPGYDGISPFLAQHPLAPMQVGHAYSGVGTLTNVDALKDQGTGEFTVALPSEHVIQQNAPQVLLDFGRDANGRLEFVSDSDNPAQVTVQYGESEDEALHGPYLGNNPVLVPAHSTAYAPKSTFRYALVRFIGGSREIKFKTIQLDLIYYPVKYKGYFESSDKKLNLMWTIGAYTAHLCMQDGIWDAPKRDRGRWMGDLDVSGRTIEDAFGDHFLMEDTLNRLMGPAPIDGHVNGIAGYSAFWITGETEYYKHTGSKQQLMAYHDRLIQLMDYMEKELDNRNLYANNTHSWPFVDWSPELNGDTPEARRATQFEFYAAFRDGVYLLEQMGDSANAQRFQQKATEMKAASQKYLLDSATNSFGERWQTNAMAVLSDVADPSQYPSIWKASLSTVGHVQYNAYIITPYYNYYVISAMAKMGHRNAALDWIRQYWGGMIDEGATSFWEGYDPSWYKQNYHASLQADNGTGYYVSLAHGWSTGAMPWLMEQMIGIQATAPGFSQVNIRPDLMGLDSAKGGEPTPRGMLDVAIKKAAAGMNVSLDLPAGTDAHVSVPSGGGKVTVNGKSMQSTPAENGARRVVDLSAAGHYEIVSQ